MRLTDLTRLAAGALLAAALATPAHGQMADTPIINGGEGATFVLGAGPAFPVGDLRDFGKNGFAGLLAVGFAPAILPVGLRVEGMYQEFGIKGGDANISTLGAGANVVLRVPQSAPGSGFFVRPFITGGVGYARTRIGLGSATAPDVGRGNGVTWNVGGGIALPIPIINVGIEARYVEVRADGGSLGSVPVFLTLNFHR